MLRLVDSHTSSPPSPGDRRQHRRYRSCPEIAITPAAQNVTQVGQAALASPRSPTTSNSGVEDDDSPPGKFPFAKWIGKLGWGEEADRTVCAADSCEANEPNSPPSTYSSGLDDEADPIPAAAAPLAQKLAEFGYAELGNICTNLCEAVQNQDEVAVHALMVCVHDAKQEKCFVQKIARNAKVLRFLTTHQDCISWYIRQEMEWLGHTIKHLTGGTELDTQYKKPGDHKITIPSTKEVYYLDFELIEFWRSMAP